MKKIFTLIAMAMMTMASQAQVVLVDLNGKEYTSGEFTITPEIDPDWGDVIFKAPSVKNNGSSAVNVSLGINIKALPANTSVQYCYPDNCFMCDEAKLITTEAASVAAGDTRSTATEWLCYDAEADDYAFGTCTIEFTIYENGQKGNVVTVNYVYADPAGIATVDKNATVVKTYDLQGREATNASGIVIEKMSNGKVRKVIK